MHTCMDDTLSILGFKVHIRIESSDADGCMLVNQLRSMKQPDMILEKVREVLREHGGCKIVSSDPLIVETRDGAFRVAAEPLSPLANLYWGRLVDAIRRECG